jgi:hypothetical protein
VEIRKIKMKRTKKIDWRTEGLSATSVAKDFLAERKCNASKDEALAE